MRSVCLNLFFAFAVITIAFTSVNAQATSPITMPKTLLSLYQASDSIVVGRFAKFENAGVVSEDPDHPIVRVRQYFDISYVLKGENKKFLTLTVDEFRPLEARIPVNDEFDLASGDTVLLFLRKTENRRRLELVDAGEALKKLSPTDLAVYEKRITELRSIYDSDSPDPSEIVNWLVRCVEHPATRWEGAFELILNLERELWLDKQAEAKVDRPQPAAPLTYSKYLTDDHKLALADILFDQSQDNSREVRGDSELIELVGGWADARLTAYLLEQIRKNPKPSYALTVKIQALMRSTESPEAVQLIEKYNQAIAKLAAGGDQDNAATDALNQIVSVADKQLKLPHVHTRAN